LPIQKLHLQPFDERWLDAFTGPERLFERTPRFQIAKSGSDERAPLSGLNVLEFDDCVNIAVQVKVHAILKIAGINRQN